MAIPDFQTIMLPLLQLAGDGQEHALRDAVDTLADQFHVSLEERAEVLPSGGTQIFHSRVGWARSYLKKAGLLETTRRGFFKIALRGRDTLKHPPERITVKFLEQFPEFAAFRQTTPGDVHGKTSIAIETTEKTPDEVLELAHQTLRQELAQDILVKILACSPAFFENLVVELLVKMGYGGSRADAGQRIGQSGDGGIDGIIKEDKLGLDVIYIQAKRWQGSVGRPEIQKFVGALTGQGSSKGVFITTSTFTTDAKDYAERIINTKVVLVDGQRLASLMMDHDVGVAVAATYQIKRIDSDYFEEA